MVNFPVGFLTGSIIVAVLAYHDFHRPFEPSVFRAYVVLGRYLLALAIYVLSYLFLYSILIQLFGIFVRWWSSFSSYATFIPEQSFVDIINSSTRGVAILAVCTIVLITYLSLPVLSSLVLTARQGAQRLAYYPRSLEAMLDVLDEVPFSFQFGGGRQFNARITAVWC